jgi:hypothetical protein
MIALDCNLASLRLAFVRLPSSCDNSKHYLISRRLGLADVFEGSACLIRIMSIREPKVMTMMSLRQAI